MTNSLCLQYHVGGFWQPIMLAVEIACHASDNLLTAGLLTGAFPFCVGACDSVKVGAVLQEGKNQGSYLTRRVAP